jgi:predicted molibdopterin-dependent oxidoreductase YjgC
MRSDLIAFTFDGATIPAEGGQTVAAALIADGHRTWRHTRIGGAPRGVFCGIGVCFDCLITINGQPNQRACLVEAHQGDVIATQEGTGHGELSC